MEEQPGDERIVPFSFENEEIKKEQVSCYLTYTNSETHRIIRENLHRDRGNRPKILSFHRGQGCKV